MTHDVTRARLSRIASLSALAGFVLLTLCARWNAIEAQPGVQQKKKSTPLAPAKDTTPKQRAETAHTLTGGKKVDAHALAKAIDQYIQRRLTQEKVKPAPLADDAQFLRRVYLDLVGVIPPPENVKAFLESKDPNKRAKVIDELLADPRFGTYLAERWANLMVPRDSMNRLLKNDPLKNWLADGFNKGEQLNKLVYELLTATGTQNESGAVTFFIANNSVDKITDNVTRMFLGVQLQCAQCHNHPFTDYKQNEYWAMAAFFMRTRVTANPQMAAKKGIAPSVTEVAANKKAIGKKKLPESAKIVPAKFLRGESPKMNPNDPARPVLAHWITSDQNPYFAPAMANRFWHQLFGRGIVNPVDDMHADNAAVMPEVLATLAEQFRLNQYNVKFLVRAVCNTQAYQRTSRTPPEGEAHDPDLYAGRAVRVLAPEQLYDSLTQVLGAPPKGAVAPKGVPKKKGFQGPRQQFVNFFRVEDANPLEYQAGIPQALRLMNSFQLNRTEPAVAAALKADKDHVIDQIYLMTVSRPPTPPERQRMEAYVTKHGDTSRTYGDILWALLNSSEFVTNH